VPPASNGTELQEEQPPAVEPYTEEEEPEEPEEIAVEEEEQPDEVQAEEPAAQDVAVSQQEPAPAAPANKPAAAPSKGPMSWAALASKNCPTVPVAPPKPSRTADDSAAAEDETAEESVATGETEGAASSGQSVVVKGIVMDVKEDEIRRKMEEFGPVSKVNLHLNTGGKTGYAFVEFASSDGAKALLSSSDAQLKIDGHDCTLKVEEKRGRTTGGKYDTGGRGRGRGREGRGNGKVPATVRSTNGTGASTSGKRTGAVDTESGAPMGGRGGRGRADGSYSTGRGEGKSSAKEGGRGRGGSKAKRPEQ